MTNTAYADQFHAASRDAVGQLKQMARHTHLRPSMPTIPLTIGSWLRDQLCGVIASLEAGSATFCKHIRGGPQVMYTTAWAPGRFTCQRCVPSLRTTTRHQDFTCDQCGKHHDTIHPRIVNLGPILFGYGRCTRCLDPLTGA